MFPNKNISGCNISMDHILSMEMLKYTKMRWRAIKRRKGDEPEYQQQYLEPFSRGSPMVISFSSQSNNQTEIHSCKSGSPDWNGDDDLSNWDLWLLPQRRSHLDDVLINMWVDIEMKRKAKTNQVFPSFGLHLWFLPGFVHLLHSTWFGWMSW